MSVFEQPIAAIIQSGKLKSQMLADAVLAGHHGVALQNPEAIPDQHFPVVIGAWTTTAPWLHRFRREQRPFATIDNGYFQGYPSGSYFRATLNGMQYDVNDGRSLLTDWNRWRDLGMRIEPWRDEGQHVLVSLQTARWFSMMGLDRETWLAQVLLRLRASTTRDILVREKPGKNTLNAPSTSFEEDLVDAHAVVALSSNTLLQATMAGVPAFPQGLCAASPLGLPDLSRIEQPWRPLNREAIYRRLAGAQWTLGEMQTGMMWRDLAEGNPRRFQDLA